MPRLKNRRGAILVLAAFAVVTLVMMLAFVVDLSQLFVQKNELQTGSDAGAIAGALQLSQDTTHVSDSAVTTGNRNIVLNRAPSFSADSVKCGAWDGIPINGVTPNNWHSGSPHALPCVPADNAVQVSGSDPTSYLFAAVLNVVSGHVGTVAVAWIAPTVDQTHCLKPLAVDYSLLLQALDPYRGGVARNPLRVLDGIDYNTLHTESKLLTFCLKDGTTSNQKCPNTAMTAGSFGIVGLAPGDNGGTYRPELGADCSEQYPVGAGDNVDVITGNKVGQTDQGVKTYCSPRNPCIMKFPLYDDPNTDPGATYPTDKPATDAAQCKGQISGTNVCYKVVTIGAAVIDYPPLKTASNGVITGHFTIANDPGGAIGPNPGLLQRVILVK